MCHLMVRAGGAAGEGSESGRSRAPGERCCTNQAAEQHWATGPRQKAFAIQQR